MAIAVDALIQHKYWIAQEATFLQMTTFDAGFSPQFH